MLKCYHSGKSSWFRGTHPDLGSVTGDKWYLNSSSEASLWPSQGVAPPLWEAAGSSKGSPRGTAPPRSGLSNSFRAAEKGAAEWSEDVLACLQLPGGCRVETVWPNLLAQPRERE